MPTRLPIPGQDANKWGEILNEYLLVSHSITGTLNPNTVGTSQLTNNAVSSSHLQNNAITLDKLTPELRDQVITATGTPGQDGQDGDDGADGREIELRATATHIQWRYTGTTTWTNLVELDDIRGPQGDQGIQGQQGNQGERGERGLQGEQGIQGPPGASGATTIEGIDGLQEQLDGKADADHAHNEYVPQLSVASGRFGGVYPHKGAIPAESLGPADAGTWFVVQGEAPLVGKLETPITGNIALIGDSLIEGLAYTPSIGETVGQKMLQHGQAPMRYWLAPRQHEGMMFQVSTITGSATPISVGIPYAFRLAQGGKVRWSLPPGITEVRPAFRRDDGTGFKTWATTVTAENNFEYVMEGSTNDSTGFGTDVVAVPEPGAWVEVEATGGVVEIFGVEVLMHSTDRNVGTGIYSFGVSGADSYNLEHMTHQWRALTPYMRNKLGVTTVITQIGVNDSISNTPKQTYKDRFIAASNQLTVNGGIPNFIAVIMPNSGGVSGDISIYRDALHELAGEGYLTLLDALDLPLRFGIEVGADSLHWLPTGNQAFVDTILSPPRSGSGICVWTGTELV